MGLFYFSPGGYNHQKAYCQGAQLRVQLALSYHISLSKAWKQPRGQLAASYSINLSKAWTHIPIGCQSPNTHCSIANAVFSWGCRFFGPGQGTLFLDLYMFFGPGRYFFGPGGKKCGGRACVFSGPCGDIFFWTCIYLCWTQGHFLRQQN